MKKLSVIALSFLVSCAPIPQSYEPIIDFPPDTNMAKYQEDLKICRSYASRICPTQSAASGAIAGALLGAAFGAILGAGYDNAGRGALTGAGAGSLSAGAHSGVNAMEEQKRIIKNCMKSRGYAVLN
jgi:outer membrane lipoprotein SlyB